MNTIIELQAIKAAKSAAFQALKPVKAPVITDQHITSALLDTYADTAHKVPAMAASDKVKAKGILIAIRSARQSASHHLANGLHHTNSRNGWMKIDRIAAIANAIDKFSRLNPAVLKGGDALKSELIALAWLAYADLEVHGFDNAHYLESQIPMDERQEIADDGCNVGSGFRNDEYRHELRYMA